MKILSIMSVYVYNPSPTGFMYLKHFLTLVFVLSLIMEEKFGGSNPMSQIDKFYLEHLELF